MTSNARHGGEHRHGGEQQSRPTTRERFLAATAFPPDPFQVAAFDALDDGRSVLVAAPTGSGKTLVAAYAVAKALAEGGKAFYTTPLKALSNQKYGELCAQVGPARVGLLTGDNSHRPEAPVLVMTTEVLRNMIYAASPALAGLRYVILDEVHYLQNPYRGAVWEEVIVHAPPAARLVCLSATVSNAEQVAAWLTTARGETTPVIEETRPVDLEHLYLVGDRGAERAHLLPTFVDGRPNPDAAALDSPAVRPGHHPRSRSRLYRPRRPEVVERLSDESMLPAIYFIFSRAACDDAVTNCMREGLRLTTAEERAEIRAIAEARTAALSDTDLVALRYGEWIEGLAAGFAAHHAGLVPPFKETVEACFNRALVKVVFATETLSLGINMPARSVVIDSLSKFTGERHQPLTPGEYTQLTGRAGRRGIDDRGYAIVTWSPWASFSEVAGLASTRSYELTSSFRPTYNMAVNLVRRYDRARAHQLLSLSFGQYRTDADVVAIQAKLERTQELLSEASAAAHCERGDLAGYLDLERNRRSAARAGLGPPSARTEIQAALARLRPGELVTRKGIPLAVVATARRRGGGVRVAAVGRRGRRELLAPDDFDAAPAVVGRIDLPVPYNPSDPAFLAAVATRLRGVATTESADERPERPQRRAKGAPHPVAGCPQLRAHIRAAERAERLGRDVERLHEAARSRRGSLAAQLDRVLGLLERRRYVCDWKLEPRGERLGRIYHEQDLLIAECIDEGVLDGLDAPSLAAVASVFTFEARGRQVVPSKLRVSPDASFRWVAVEQCWRALQADEVAFRLPTTRPPDPGFMGPAQAWAAGRSLSAVLEDGCFPGGDFVRNVKQLADLLGQIADVAPEPDTATTARRAADSLLRGVVAASSLVEVSTPSVPSLQ
ncbi:MAG: DEAD/DEAH box helicase [Actinomycetota bacterium]|nr:DEAD/DEAH box helicase [Actinomycetota bacterium]